VVAAIAVLLALPLSSLGSTSPLSTLSNDLSTALKGATTKVQSTVQSTVQKVASSTSRSSTIARSNTASNSAPAQSSSSTYTPPGYGTNPHGQGTVGSVSLGPSQTRPYTYSPAGSSSQNEVAVIGRGRSEQQPDGTYDAHTTILALFGNELLGVDANQGQTAGSPLSPLQTVLTNICTSSNGALCLTLLAADTAATSSGASTHFEAAGVHIAPNGTPVLGADAATSSSAISTSGSCQTSSGGSQVANATLGGNQLASVAKSATSSSACTGQTPTQSDTSSVIGLGNQGLPIPAPGCADGTPNTLSGIAILLPIICNADDQTQVEAPFGVREALTVLGLNPALNQSLIRAATAASESHAVAPPAAPSSSCSDSDKDCGAGETCVNGHDPDGDGDCTGNTSNTSGNQPSGNKKCKDSDHDCGVGPNGQPEVCVNGADPDGDGDCTAATGSSGQKCSDSDHDCGIGPNGQQEACVNGSDPDADADCSSQVTALAAKTTLPFTGENVLLVILVGLLLTGGGLTLATRLRASSHKRR
jgi:hypothetical protein